MIAGTSKERSANALEQMGPAILNGGITTFLALFFLAFSQSYAFIVFFKVSEPRLPDGDSRISRLYVFGPTLHCKI